MKNILKTALFLSMLLASERELKAYKEIPYVHSWVAVQAWNILPDGKAKAEINQFMYGGASFNSLFGSNSVWLSDYAFPSAWSDDKGSGDSILEGTVEEDQDEYNSDGALGGISVTWARVPSCFHHFWNPDLGYIAGLNDEIQGVTFSVRHSNLEQAQIWWRQAVARYAAGNKPKAYYLLGRVAHLLGDLGVPEHVHAESHLGGHLDLGLLGVHLTRDLYSNYEEYTKLYYRKFAGSGPAQDAHNLPLPFPGENGTPAYSNAPADFDLDLARLFYNQAEFTQHFDSSRHDGNDTVFGDGPRLLIDAENGASRMPYRAVDYLRDPFANQPAVGDAVVNDGIDPGTQFSVEWKQQNLPEGPRDGFWFDISRGKGQLMYPETLFNSKSNFPQEPVIVSYTFRGTPSHHESLELDADAPYFAVPDRNVTNQMAILFPENIRYTAGLYQLFWEKTHETITTIPFPPEGGTLSGGGTVDTNSSVTVTATASPCFKCTGWAENGVSLTTDSNYTFTANSNRTLTANFVFTGQYTPPTVVTNPPPEPLSVVAKQGDSGISSIRSGVSINDQGTVAFAAFANGVDGNGIFAVPKAGGVKFLASGGASFYGVQINNRNDIAYVAGPGISTFDYCLPDPANPDHCLDLPSAILTYAIGTVNATNPASRRTLVGSALADSCVGCNPHTLINQYSRLGPAFSINNTGQVAFVGDISLPPQDRIENFQLGTLVQRTNYPMIPAEPLTRPLLADNGRIILKSPLATNGPLTVWEYNLARSTTIASAADHFDWTGLYPGITQEGNDVAFVGSVSADSPCLPPGQGLFLKTFTNNVWVLRRILGTNDNRGTNLFRGFDPLYRTCVANAEANTRLFLFVALSPTGRPGLYGATYNIASDTTTLVPPIMEIGSNIPDLGSASNFELHDSLNEFGDVAFWIQTASGDAVVRGTIFPTLQAIDPLPEPPGIQLVGVNGIFTTDTTALADPLLKDLKGFAADGVTRLLLRVPAPGDGQVTFSVEDEKGISAQAGTLAALNSTNFGSYVITNSVQSSDGTYMAFAVLKAPTDFARPLEAQDENAISRSINIKVMFKANGVDQLLTKRQLNLHRPPVALLHGLWSDATTWKWELKDDSRFDVYAHDYHDTHADSFLINRFQAETAALVALHRARTNHQIAAVQADFVGHSMGGLLARLFVSTGDSNSVVAPLRYLRSDNYFQGDIHKLITVDTPHAGSPFANQLIDDNGSLTQLGAIWERTGDCVQCGAVADLRTDSTAIKLLPAAKVPAHAIVGTGGQFVLGVTSDVASLIADVTQVDGLSAVISFARFWYRTVIGSDSHDLLVTAESQGGNLKSSHTSPFAYEDLFSPGIHFTVTYESRIGQRVVDLLNAPITDVQFEVSGFPSNSPAPSPLRLSSLAKYRPVARAASAPSFVQGLNIISPASGTSVSAGATVTVTVAATNAFHPSKVLLIGPWGAELNEAEPFTLGLNVPTNWLGPLSVKAFGVDSNGVFAESPELILNITTTATVTNISLRPDTIYLFDYAKTKQVEVYGQYSDGVERKLTPSQGTFTFSADNLTIASVTTEGLVDAQRIGNTTVRVQAAGLRAAAPVLVMGTPFTNTLARDQHLEIIELGTNISQVVDLNNAGQVLCYIGNGSSYRPAMWQNGTIIPLLTPPSANIPPAIVNKLSESGVVSGGNGLAILWLSPTNYVYVTYPDGSLFSGANGAAVAGVHDSDAGLIGLAGLGGGSGIGDPPPGTFFRFSGTQVVLPSITPVGIPAGYTWTPGQRLNRSGTLISHVDHNDPNNGVFISLPALLDASNHISVLPGGIGSAVAINDTGDVAGNRNGVATLWRNGMPTTLRPDGALKATAVNNHSHVAVYADPSSGTSLNGGAIWASGRIIALTDLFPRASGWQDFGAIEAMNDNGWLLCTAGRADGTGGGFVIIKLAPSITQQPISRTKIPGQSVTFGVSSYGVGDMTYQWRHNGTNLSNSLRISGADAPQLTINPIEISDAGEYALFIQDAYGNTTSSNAMLTVFAEGCLPTADRLVAHWSGDGNSQEMLNRYTATLVNGTSFSNGMANSAFNFDGVDDFITTDLNVSPDALPVTTWEAWILPTRTNYVDFQEIFDDLKDFRVLYIQGGNQFSISGAGGGLPTVSLNEWQHIAVVFYPNGLEFYKNSEKFTTWYVPGLSTGSSLLAIGGRPDNTLHFQGLIDEVSVYNRALSQAEIQAIYDVGPAGKCRPAQSPSVVVKPPNQVAYAGFDVTFPCVVHGTAPITYQWYFNETNIIFSGTNLALALRNIQSENSGEYTLVARNAYGVTETQSATLEVRPSCENEWRQISSAPNFNLPSAKAMAYDSARRVTVFLYDGETWEWNGTAWRLASVKGANSPGPGTRDGTRMVYDSGRGVTVLFGGSAGVLINDTWEWDGTTWTLAASSGPAPRAEHAMAFDAARGVTVLFGGYKAPFESYSDTWIWDGFSWCRVGITNSLCVPTECASPAPRRAHDMAYDSISHKVILFGGASSIVPGISQPSNDTWEWDGECWQERFTVQSPPARYYFSMAYDSERQTTILYGGNSSSGTLSDTWALFGNSWIQVPTSGPGPRTFHSMAYDSSRNVLLLGSGTEVWEWSTPDVPLFIAHPANETRFVGELASLDACATGRGSVGYQWFRDGTNAVVGANASTLQIEHIDASKAGNYLVIASNSFGSVTSVVATLTVLPCQSAPSGLISWWPANDSAMDVVSTNHGILANGVGFSPGQVGRALRFDGIDDFVKINASSNLNLLTAKNLTIEGWINPADLAPRPLVEWNRGSNVNTSIATHFWASMSTNGSVPGALFANVKDRNHSDHALSSPPGILKTNQYQHVAMTYSAPSGLMTLYHNGRSVAEGNVLTAGIDTAADLYLGYRPGTTNLFNGLMDEISIYNRVLSSNEIALIYRAGTLGKCLEPDGTPYVYLNGVNYRSNTVTMLTPPTASVSMLSTFSNATIRYTLNGSAPSNGLLYSGAFDITQSLTLRAIAYDSSGTHSAEADPLVVTLVEAFLNRLTIVRIASGAIRVSVRGVPETRYLVQASTDLVHWINLTNIIATENLIEIMDIDAVKYPQRFYRWIIYDAAGEIGTVTHCTNGALNFQFTGLAGRSYVLQASTDLEQWSDIRTNVSTSGVFNFTNSIDPAFSKRFFRLRSH